MQTLEKKTECIKILLFKASKDMHTPLVSILYPLLCAHISRSEFQHFDLRLKELCGIMAILVAGSGDN